MGKLFIFSILASFSLLARQSSEIVDTEVKKTQIQMDMQQHKIQRDLGPDSSIDDSTVYAPEVTGPVDVAPIEWGEQQRDMQNESMVNTPNSDPGRAIEQEVLRKQQIDKQRARYRSAIQRQFDDNLEAAGVTTRRNIAEELRKLEELQKAYK